MNRNAICFHRHLRLRWTFKMIRFYKLSLETVWISFLYFFQSFFVFFATFESEQMWLIDYSNPYLVEFFFVFRKDQSNNINALILLLWIHELCFYFTKWRNYKLIKSLKPFIIHKMLKKKFVLGKTQRRFDTRYNRIVVSLDSLNQNARVFFFFSSLNYKYPFLS